ncbi:MAG TPA: PEP-CTERM sorting domain-containing protein [Vicinamibacterales bacterium]|nr:PEP-CTERM sorting domain-containing protein [Vicinamibacterales bacterium]
MRRLAVHVGLSLVAMLWLGASSAFASPFGPTPYLQASDSPFASVNFLGGYFYLEDFEDHALNTPGVSGSPGGVTSILFGSGYHDSVDADDGAIDGSGLRGDDWFDYGATVSFSFSAAILGALPTHAGMVWTDGPFGTAVNFIAIGSDGVTTVCNITGSGFANSSFNGETAEDRFFGCSDPGGISSMTMTNLSGGGIEIDHVQYGRAGSQAAVPEPASLVLLGSGLAVAAREWRKKRQAR